jgi:hypothetical protein
LEPSFSTPPFFLFPAEQVMKAFLTGSHVFGRPGPESDIDLCIMVDPILAGKLRDMSESTNTCRFGRLNLILCESDLEFAAWKMSTERLRQIKTATGAIFDKIAAHAEFEKDRVAVGIQYKGDSGENFSPEDRVEKLPKR